MGINFVAPWDGQHQGRVPHHGAPLVHPVPQNVPLHAQEPTGIRQAHLRGKSFAGVGRTCRGQSWQPPARTGAFQGYVALTQGSSPYDTLLRALFASCSCVLPLCAPPLCSLCVPWSCPALTTAMTPAALRGSLVLERCSSIDTRSPPGPLRDASSLRFHTAQGQGQDHPAHSHARVRQQQKR